MRVIITIAAAWWAWARIREARRGRGACANDPKNPTSPQSPQSPKTTADFSDFAAVSPAHFAALDRARRAFDDARALSFQYAFLGQDLVLQMFDAREDMLTALGELRMRLPNDLDVELAFARRAEALDRAAMDAIDDARRRANAHVHPGPAGPGGWVRPVDDVIA